MHSVSLKVVSEQKRVGTAHEEVFLGFIGGIHATSLLVMGLICPTKQVRWVTEALLMWTEIFSHQWLSKVTDHY